MSERTDTLEDIAKLMDKRGATNRSELEKAVRAGDYRSADDHDRQRVWHENLALELRCLAKRESPPEAGR